jgi:hypothetical protein
MPDALFVGTDTRGAGDSKPAAVLARGDDGGEGGASSGNKGGSGAAVRGFNLATEPCAAGLSGGRAGGGPGAFFG